MDEREWPEEGGGEFGNEGNPPGARAPRSPAFNETGAEGNPPGMRPEDAAPPGEEEEEGIEGEAPVDREVREREDPRRS